jgi:hypothetical protein
VWLPHSGLCHVDVFGSVRYPGIKIHETRVIRLMEVLLHGGTHVGGWTAKEIHEAVLTTFGLSEKRYRLNQLRYDLRKLKGHGLLERDGTHYAYRLTTKGVEVALLFLFFHKSLCGPLANSRFHHPTLNADPIAGSRRPIIVPMQQSRKSSICSLPLDVGLPLLESFSQTSAGQESSGVTFIGTNAHRTTADWATAFTGRFGYTFDRVLGYGKVGAAVERDGDTIVSIATREWL